MKRILTLILAFAAIISCCAALSSCDILSSCTMEEISNLGNSIKEGSMYDYAIISFPTGYTQKVELESFLLDVNNNDMIFIYGRDGRGYVLSPENCMLVNDPNIDINAKSAAFKSYKIDYDKVILKTPDGEIITINKPEKDTISTFAELYVDDNGNHYYTSDRNIIIEFTYE